MSDSFSETTSQSWFSRIGSAFKGVLVGGALFLIAFPLLFWNEGRAVTTARSLEEGAKAVVPISADSVDSTNEGKFVHLTGEAVTEDTLTDPLFGVTVENAIRLKREVQMFQWVEYKESKEKKKLGGGTETTTTYRYETEWKPSLQNSSGFRKPEGHTNPSAMPYTDDSWTAGKVTLGAFTLNDGLKRQISGSTNVPVDIAMLPKAMHGKVAVSGGGYYQPANPVGDSTSPTPGETTDPPMETDGSEAGSTDGSDGGEPSGESGDGDEGEKPDDSAFDAGLEEVVFLDDTETADESTTTDAEGNDPSSDAETPDTGEETEEPAVDTSTVPQPNVPGSPQVGDVRITFTKTEEGNVSVLAQQMGDSFGAYQTKAGDALLRLDMGTLSAEEMIAKAAAENTMLTWILRIVGLAMMFFGLMMVFKPLSVLADVVPFIGNVMEFGSAVIAGLIAITCGFLTIGVAWLFYRPLIGVPLLLVALVGGFFVVKMLFGGRKSEPEAV